MFSNLKNTVGITIAVCLVASILVSIAAVGLKPKQVQNQKLDLLTNILAAGDLLEEGTDVQEIYNNRIQPEIIDVTTGETVPEDQYDDLVNVESYDIEEVAKSPVHSLEISPELDKAGINRMPKEIAIYKVIENDQVSKYIFPIYGKGLWSTLYGFIALDKDLHTVKGFTFYKHGETPGLGGEVDNPKWKSSWIGKQAFDENWELKIEVLKGQVDLSNTKSIHQIDGLSGSTLTTRGVNDLVRFWLGDNGYRRYIDRLREEK
jgi:Na+-transporting NADH:ubiquinone oxidoreductase subunit C